MMSDCKMSETLGTVNNVNSLWTRSVPKHLDDSNDFDRLSLRSHLLHNNTKSLYRVFITDNCVHINTDEPRYPKPSTYTFWVAENIIKVLWPNKWRYVLTKLEISKEIHIQWMHQLCGQIYVDRSLRVIFFNHRFSNGFAWKPLLLKFIFKEFPLREPPMDETPIGNNKHIFRITGWFQFSTPWNILAFKRLKAKGF